VKDKENRREESKQGEERETREGKIEKTDGKTQGFRQNLTYPRSPITRQVRSDMGIKGDRCWVISGSQFANWHHSWNHNARLLLSIMSSNSTTKKD
jgi:hypothetical protein